jgi:acetyltransferase-like isoleucine patch superfamily enzyme
MSAFTALNSGSPKASDPPSIQVDSSAAVADGQEKTASEAPSIQREPLERRSLQGQPYHDAEGSLKRKRSNSLDRRQDGPSQERTPDTATVPPHDHRDRFGTPHREYRQYSPDNRDKDHWYSQQSRNERSQFEGRARSVGSPVDDQVGENRRRATSQGDHGEYPNTSPEADDRSASIYGGGQYTPEHRQSSVLQHGDPKKRKRNFSNRTKTGCMTCRKRKKKCDEQKPECELPPLHHALISLADLTLAGMNCIKGSFVCAGYPPQRGPGWQKPDNKSPTIPLESKDPSYVPPGAYGMPQQSSFSAQPVKREPLPPYRGQALRIDPPQGHPLVTDDDRPTATTLPSASVASPDNKLSAMPYTPANAFPTPVSANTQPPPFADRMAKDYQRVPPLHDLSRTEPESSHPNHLPQINILHAGRSSPGPSGQHLGSNVQVAAQLALSHSQYPSRRTQKEEMLSGRSFYPFDKELCLERERCATACWKFNTLTTPPCHGVSADERARLFLEILQPRDPIRISPTEASPVSHVGRVGRNVAVETPFICDYGYNITIGHFVSIGRNCTINDVAEVKIGDNCVIGHNVSIFTATLPIDPKRRQGGQAPQTGKGVVIEQDCWIAGGAIILAGRTIGKGSTVGAGSVVTKVSLPLTGLYTLTSRSHFVCRMSLRSPSWLGTRHGSSAALHLDSRVCSISTLLTLHVMIPNQVYANMIFPYVLRILNGILEYLVTSYFVSLFH